MSKLLLIDGDMVAHRCARSCEPTKAKPYLESLDEAIFRSNDLLYRIINTFASTEYRLFISGDRNFRKQLDPSYKANRASQPKATHLDPIRELLVREWQAEICDGYEADDGIGMAHNELTIIVSNDKDFRTLEGEHFNPVKNEFEVVDEQMAAYNFYSLMLIGDPPDNIRGVDGVGAVGAKRILSNLDSIEMHNTVRGLYKDEKRFLLNYRLFRILRSVEEFNEIEATIRESQGEETPADSAGPDLEELRGTVCGRC